MSQRSDVPSDCAGVVNSLGAGAVVDAGVDLGATSSMATPILGEDILATTPSDVPPLGEPVMCIMGIIIHLVKLKLMCKRIQMVQ
jgi:hypothetical protein